MVDGSGLEMGVQIETCACMFCCIRRDGVMPSLTQLLSQPEIDSLARERGGRHLRAHGRGLQLLIGVVWKRKMEIPHAT